MQKTSHREKLKRRRTPLRRAGVTALAAFALTAGAARGEGIIYVDAARTGGLHNGNSWANAYQDLQPALQRARNDESVTQIWVARGTYRPDTYVNPGSRIPKFALVSGVAIYGGFAGTETSLSERDHRANPTVLSGDLGNNDASGIFTDNSYRVVDATAVGEGTILDGFIISGGNADSTGGINGYVGGGLHVNFATLIVRHCVFTGNRSDDGGAAVLADYSVLTLENCIFRNNQCGLGAGSGGGAVLSRFGSEVRIVNTLMTGNSADYGGAVDAWHGGVTLLNCTLHNNHAAISGGAVEASHDLTGFPESASATIANTILWGNTAGTSGSQLAQVLGTNGFITISYSTVQGGLTSVDMSGGGNLFWDLPTMLSSDPLFADAGGRLSSGSPAIDAGNNDLAYIATDLDGHGRLTDGGSGAAIVDLGAFEFYSGCVVGMPPPGGMMLLDWDSDGDIDRVDHDAFQTCMAGPAHSLSPGCRVFDVDNDCNVDLADYVHLQKAMERPPEVPPTLCVSPATLNFGSSSTSLTFSVWNCGGTALDYTISESSPWITSVTPTSGSSLGEQDLITVTVSRSGLADGRYDAPLTITSGTGGTPQTVNVIMYVGTSGLDMTAASRTSGVAPLAVFFDALDPASGIVQPGDGDHAAWHYFWDFGDPASGSWTSNGQSRNEATGYVAAHVYDQPGAYLVTLTVESPAGEQYEYRQLITVDDPAVIPGWKTYYVAANGADTNDGRTTSTPFRTFSKAMSVVGTNRAVRFRRGDTFTAPFSVTLSADGPGLIGAYGDPALPRPVILCGSLSYAFRPLKPHWRIQDLEMRGDARGNMYNCAIDGGAGATTYLLLERLKVQGFYTPILTTYYPVPIAHDHVFLVDCEIFGTANKGCFLGGTRQVVLGNHIHDNDSHLVRLWHARKAIISENRLMDPKDPAGAVIKLHNATEVPNLPEGRWVVIADNIIRGHTWAVTIGTQGAWANETVRDVVVERNFVDANPTTLIGIRISGQNVLARNNIGDLTGASGEAKLVGVTRWGIEPPPTGARLFNNNVFRADNGFAKLLDATWGDTLIYNNIAWAASGNVTLGGGSGSFSNNLTTNPRWVNPAAGDFRLQSNSPAIDTGRVVPVLDDYLQGVRPVDGNGSGGAQFDIGAVEYAP
jgi:hypothetical protein